MEYYVEQYAEPLFNVLLRYAVYAIIALVALSIVYALKGPSIWDRLLALNLISAKIIMVIILFSSIEGITFMLDIAILYALFGFMGTIFIALFLARHRLGKIRQAKAKEKVENKIDGGEE